MKAGKNDLKWDVLDVTELLESAIDSFAVQFYCSPFSGLPKKAQRRVLRSIASIVKEKSREAKDGN